MVYHVILPARKDAIARVQRGFCWALSSFLLEPGKMTRVFIGRLSMSARESDVERFLRGYGKVRDISLKRGYGFVVRNIRIVPIVAKSFFVALS